MDDIQFLIIKKKSYSIHIPQITPVGN